MTRYTIPCVFALAVLLLALAVPPSYGAASPLRHASDAALARHTGLDFNGLCCNLSANMCTVNAPLGHCGASLPSGCDCTGPTGPASNCTIFVTTGEYNEVCQNRKPIPNETDDCHQVTPNYWCYSYKAGDCDHDGGGWSTWNFCWLCGCVEASPSVQTGGDRTLCAAGSTGC